MTLLELFRILSTFDVGRVSLKEAPWDAYVNWSISNGLAPMAAYNLEYRLAGADAPEWARDRLLSVYQGSVNDNVMKLVAFKRAVGELDGRKILLFGGAAFADALYPHVAFRPLPELRLWVKPIELDPFANFLGDSDFKPIDAEEAEGARKVLSDEHTTLLLFTRYVAERSEEGVWNRAVPMKVYGPSIFRPSLEDALLLTCLEHARRGYDVAALSFVDLRELALGSPNQGGPYARKVDTDLVKSLAKEWRMERALFTSLAIVQRLFPQATEAVEAMLPPLRPATRALLQRTIVEPVSQLGKVRLTRGMDRLRRLLSGG